MTRDELTSDLFRTMWAAGNLQMQLIRCIEKRQLFAEELHEAHVRSIEDRVDELGTALDALRRASAWPDVDSEEDVP